MLLFTNNVLLFSKASASQVRLVGDILASFCKAFGLKVNLHTSRDICSEMIFR